MTKAACSIIISTYNWPAALRLCLHSVLKQSVLPSEIIIADDGSREETRALIERFAKNSMIPIIHVWHPDEGFQLAKIRNRAIAKASQPYIIQIDGDLILHPHFIEDHLHLRENGYFVSGSRVLLSAETSQALLHNPSSNKGIGRHHRKSGNFFNRFRNKILCNLLSTRYKVWGKYAYYVKGCNMSFWRRDLLKVNGYNEDFTGWGREDSELAIRLINAGIKKKFLKMGGITYHLFHPEASRDMDSRNTALMQMAIKEKLVVASKGLNQYG
jgi:glycosyltransferase involved in cell wall biosynthesis